MCWSSHTMCLAHNVGHRSATTGQLHTVSRQSIVVSMNRTTSLKTIAGTVLGTGSLLMGTALGASAPAMAEPTTPVAESTTAAASPDFDHRTYVALVASWYRVFLGRSASADPGSDYWVGQLDNGVAPDRVLAFVLTSPEYAKIATTSIYRAYLDRPLDPGASYWLDGVAAGSFPLEWVEQNVASSPAYLQKTGANRGQGDVAVEGWYSVILQRSPSLGERRYWTGRIRDVGALGAVRELWYTPEAVNHRVQQHYAGLLGRQASGGELAYWNDLEVRSDISVIEAIGASPEFARRALR